MEHKFISELDAGQQIDEVYMVTQPVLRSTTRGDLYIAMYLSDKTGRLNGRMWQATEEIYGLLPKEGFVNIKGRVEVYQGALQIVADHINVVSAEKVSLEDYLPRTEKNIEQMFARVKQLVSVVKNRDLKALVGAFLADEQLMQKFCRAPAAMVYHHSYLGGLLEHTLNMLEVATAILPLYPKLQAELVLAGIFLHDMGKTEELSYDTGFGYTDSGQLLGHITQTITMINRKVDSLAQKGTSVDRATLDNIQHIVLSHHGSYEFGSPKLPATAEAFMVCYIDDLDAKMNQVTEAIDNQLGDSNWTDYKKSLETRLYRRRVVE
jgi:3'-5' exoribonuclease